MVLAFFPPAGVVLAGLLSVADPSVGSAGGPDHALHDWQLRRLMAPLPHELQKERAGGVYIYDRLTEREVDRALDAHFDRIQHMMFMGPLKTDPQGVPILDSQTGKVMQESGGCGNAE